MESLIINDKENFIKLLTSCGISKQILNQASLMDLNIPKLIYEKLICKYNMKTLDEVTKNLLGVYGNYIATLYCKKMYKNVENEVPIKNEKGNIIIKADISFIDEEEKENYCEVKAASQIIDNIRNYVDEDNNELSYFTDKDNIIIKYKNIGKKLITQVKKLSSTNKKVNVFIFSGCIVDEIIKQKLKELNVRVITLATNINELEEEIKSMLIHIHDIIINNINFDFSYEKEKVKNH